MLRQYWDTSQCMIACASRILKCVLPASLQKVSVTASNCILGWSNICCWIIGKPKFKSYFKNCALKCLLKHLISNCNAAPSIWLPLCSKLCQHNPPRPIQGTTQRRDKVMCIKYQTVELAKESLPSDLLWWIEAVPSLIPEQTSCNEGAELEM